MKSKMGMGGTLSAKIIRANGKVEYLGDLSKRNWLRRLMWAVRNWLSQTIPTK